MKKSRVLLFSFLSLSTIIFTACIIPFLNQNKILLNSIESKINDPKRSVISESYKTNEFIFDNSCGTGEFNLLDSSQKNKNFLFPFAREYDAKSDSLTNNIMNHTIEVDLNIWKPVGMEDKVFLKNLQFDVSGFKEFDIINNETLQTFVNYNISIDSFSDEQKFFNNMYVQNTFSKERKLVSNLLDSDDYQFNNSKKGFCFLVFDIEHQKSKVQNTVNSINRLLVTPKIVYSYTDSVNNITLPSQDITFSFLSKMFKYDSQNQISIDSYISDNKRFNFEEKREDNKGNLVSEKNLLLDTSKGIDEVVLVTSRDPNAPDLGYESTHLIPKLKIDTSNFYLDNPDNHLDSTFEISIEGIKINGLELNVKETLADGSGTTIPPYHISIFKTPILESNNEQSLPLQNNDLNIKFEIKDSYFDASNTWIKTIPIFNNSIMLSESFNKTFANKPIGLNLELTITRVEPFKYEITQMKFVGIDSFHSVGSIIYDVDLTTTVESSDEVIVKSKPKDFSFTRMNKAVIDNVMRKQYQLHSDYSSNVFDDSNFSNKPSQGTNYQVTLNELESRFYEAIKSSNDWQIAVGWNPNQSLDLINIYNYFNSPFIKYQYTGKVNEYRTKGQMSLRYSSIYGNKYFKYLDTYMNVIIDETNNSSRKEIIEFSFKNDKLNQLIENESFTNINSLIQYLNELNYSNWGDYLNLINLDNADGISQILQGVKFTKGSKSTIRATLTLNSNH